MLSSENIVYRLPFEVTLAPGKPFPVVLLYGAKKEGSGWAEADDDLPPGPVPYDGPIITEALTLFFSAPRPVASAIARALRQVCRQRRSVSVQLLMIAAELLHQP
jgi:hypothetical protein